MCKSNDYPSFKAQFVSSALCVPCCVSERIHVAPSIHSVVVCIPATHILGIIGMNGLYLL